MDRTPIRRPSSGDEATPAPPDRSIVVGYDPGFDAAVSGGRMTIRQAVERGDRVAWATALASKRRLSMRDAFLVTDNVISLREAMARQPCAGDTGVEGKTGGRSRVYRVAVVALAISALLAWGVAREAADPPSSRTSGAEETGPVERRVETPVVEVAAVIRSDSEGRPTEVRGPDPRSVLHTFCESTQAAHPRVPGGLVVAGEAWVGSYRQGREVYEITVRKSENSEDWVAGNGVDPILPTLRP